jgi:hypothetical protein
MYRVLRHGGRLILIDHVRSSVRPIFWLQRVIEFFSVQFQSETQTRRPLDQVLKAGFEVLERDRMRAGVLERPVAIKPARPNELSQESQQSHTTRTRAAPAPPLNRSGFAE